MSKQKPSTIHLNSWDWERAHREKLARKYQKIQGLRALLEEWEAFENADHNYILELRAKLRTAEQNLAAMSL